MLHSMLGRLAGLGLQRRIMLYVTGGLLVVMAAYSVVSLQAIRQSTDLVFRERQMVAGTVAREIDDDLAQLQRAMGRVAASAATDLSDHQLDWAQGALSGIRQASSFSDSWDTPRDVILADPTGRILWSDPSGSQRSLPDLSGLPPFQAALQSLRPAIADDFSAQAAGRGSLWLVTPILSSGHPVGVLLADLDLARVSQRFAPLLETDQSGYSLELIDQNGIVISSTQPDHQWRVSDHFALVKDMLGHEQSGSAAHSVPANSAVPAHILAFVPLGTVPWGVTLEEPQDLALALPHGLQDQLLLFGVLVLLAGLVLAWVTTRAVVRPINALIGATQHIAAGNLDRPLHPAAEDEVGRLAQAFDEMRLQLQQSREEIARWNRDLEARVQRRTRELTALVQSSHALASTLDPDVLFENLIQETREVLPSAEGVAFFLQDSPSELLMVRATFGFDTAECGHLGFREGEGVPGKVFAARSPVQFDRATEILEAQSDVSPENDACFRRASGGRLPQSALGAPLVSKGIGLGALVLYNFSREQAFSENDVAILQAFADQATAAIENARLYASLQEKEAARAALLGQVIQAQEEERARVAREIHDELGQLLTRLSINLKMCETQVVAEPGQAAQTLAATQSLVWQTIEQAHRLIVELRPTLLDELGLEAALREELATRLEPHGVITTLTTDRDPTRLPSSVEIAVFRIAQEAISNIAQHAHAQHAMVSLHAGSALELCIQDDGVGIPADWSNENAGHRPLGLLGMQERAVLLGGTLRIEADMPRGTRVTLQVPLAGGALRETPT